MRGLVLVFILLGATVGSAQELPQRTPAEQLTIPITESVEPIEKTEAPPERQIANSANLGGQGGMGGAPGYRLQWFPTRPIRGRADELGWLRQDVNFGMPLYREEKNKLLFTGSVRSLWFSDSVRFPNSNRPLPENLWGVNFGLLGSHEFENGWTGSLMVNLGSASDRPFENTRDLFVSTLGFIRIPRGDNAWLFSIFYSPTSELRFPVPGIAYFWKASDQFQITLGIPFQLRWTPTENWYLQASYFPARNIRTEWGYVLDELPVTLYGGFDWGNEAFFLSDRTDDRERFFSYAKTLEGGVRVKVFERGQLEFAAGYAFDRFLFNGRNYDDRDQDRLDLQPGAFGRFAFRLRF